MGDVVDNVASHFKIAELVLIAEFLGLSPVSRCQSRKLIDVVNLKIKVDGLPEPPADEANLSRSEELVEDYLYMAGFIDDEGEPIEFKKIVNINITDFMALHNINAKPSCFSTADDGDPACARCMLYTYCGAARIQKLPPCWGLLYDSSHVECKGCFEAPFCSKSKSK